LIKVSEPDFHPAFSIITRAGIKFDRLLQTKVMNKRTLALVLLIIPVLAIGYAVYRSTAEVIITAENGRQVTYGEPQHGLTLGLCIFAGLSLLSAVLLLIDDWRKTGREDSSYTATKVSNKVATNYPH
jgi:hypothetical protein